MTGIIYFMENPGRDKIRIGYTHSLDAYRTEAHEDYGYKSVAIVRGTKTHESMLHRHFNFAADRTSDRDTSHYSYHDTIEYVTRLLDYHYAVPSIKDLDQIGAMPWQLWRPASVVRPIYEGNQACFHVTAAVKASASDSYQTPTEIVDLCRAALGGVIDLDPASCWEANSLRVKAKFIYTEFTNGLRSPWYVEDGSPSRVFLNPPYGGGVEASKFIEKLIEEREHGHVVEAITVLNAQSVIVDWFRPVWDHASCHALYKKRIDFIGALSKSGDSPGYTSAKNGTIFSYFGANPDKFCDVFRSIAILLGPPLK